MKNYVYNIENIIVVNDTWRDHNTEYPNRCYQTANMYDEMCVMKQNKKTREKVFFSSFLNDKLMQPV